MTIVIKSLEDLRQLEGWMIDKVSYEPPGIRLTLSQIASPTKIVLTFTPTLQFGLSGNLMTANLGLNMDLKEHPVEVV